MVRSRSERHDIEHNDTQHNDTQHNDILHYRLNCDAQYKWHLAKALIVIIHSVFMLSVVAFHSLLYSHV